MAQPNPTHPIKRLTYLLLALTVAAFAIRLWLFPALGHLLVNDQPPQPADAIVVLNTGVDYYPRLIEAARLVKEDLASYVVINGNRKTPILRELETAGFQPAVSWDTDRRRILNLLGVDDKQIISISAEDAYDTISEAQGVLPSIRQQNFTRLLLVTSRFHTRRAGHIWEQLTTGEFTIIPVAAKKDPFDPDAWWREGRQIKQLLAEYGGWLFYFMNPKNIG